MGGRHLRAGLGSPQNGPLLPCGGCAWGPRGIDVRSAPLLLPKNRAGLPGVRSAIFLLACLIALGVLGALFPAGNTATAEAVPVNALAVDARPNILFITTDDQRADEMWMLDRVQRRIADQGTTFQRAYANFPLCCPARATFQTGQYAHNHGVLGNLSGTSPVGGYPAFDSRSTIATWLQQAGYRTAFVGKFLNKYGTKPVTVPPGWDDWHGIVGGGNYYDTRVFENGTPHQYTGPYQTDLLGAMATSIIQESAPSTQPLFLYVSFYGPHAGSPVESGDPPIATPAVARKWRDYYANRDFPRDAAWNEADVGDKPAYVRALPRITTAMQSYIKESFQQRAEALESVDAAVNKLLTALATAGELGNTLVIFTSDNGYMSGEHRIPEEKTVPYEPSTRVPIIVRGPGFPANTDRNQLAGHIDLAPTMARAAGVIPGLTVDGVPLQDLAASTTVGTNRALLLEAGPQAIDGPWFYRGVRTDRWEYIDYDTESFVELYDMANDPDQLNNLANDPAYASQRSAMADLLAQLRNCAGSTCHP